jgi:PAS domain S-box-containing protein
MEEYTRGDSVGGELRQSPGESDEQYHRVVEPASGHATFTVGPDATVETWSESARELYGYETDEILNEPFARLWGEIDDLDEDLSTVFERASERPIAIEDWHVREDGSVFWANCTFSPMVNDRFHGYSVLTKDITSRKQYERMLERQNDRLKEFTDILSHDLRNPLNVVDGRITLYRRTGDESHLETAKQNTRRMEKLIEDLLSVARQGDVVRDPAPVDIESLVQEAQQGTLPTSASVEYERVPRVVADEDRLRQVFENLFRNAGEHAGPDVTVRVGPLSGGFYVEDDGPGIPPEIASKVFDHAFTTEENGSGFGLSVVRTIVNAHGWDVNATESESGGARFEIVGVSQFED